MKAKTQRLCMSVILAVCSLCFGQIPTSHARLRQGAAASTPDVKVYLVAVGDAGAKGKRIGCDDSLVPVSMPVESGSVPLEAAIRLLLAAPPESGDSPQLENFWRGTDLKLASVVVKKGTATIHISGEISVAGVCDEPRIVKQIEETARQFKTVKRVRVYVNGRPLAEVIR